MRKLGVAMGMAAAALMTAPRPAEACGGFFCGRQPVDQTAERILFATNQDGSVTMVTQIQYAGAAPDFAWVVPLAEVPAVDSLAVFPQLALTALDTATGPQFQWPNDPNCYPAFPEATAGGGSTSGGTDDGDVAVHIREEVGPYDVAVVESTDPTALIDWLRDNNFRVNDAMAPYIGIYTSEGMKFLALRLKPDAEVTDIQPFRFTLPSGSPSIPIRLTAIAAEPEMGITVMILGDRRYGPANWTDVEIDDDQIVWSANQWPVQTNWTALVARSVDEAGGRGFVTEMSGPTIGIADQVRNTMSSDEQQVAARDALLPLLEGNTTITRLYTRLSPEEMTVDPIFRRTDGPVVSNTHLLPRYVDDRDLCVGAPGAEAAGAASPCDFAACGAGGLCRVVEGADGAQPVAACACVPGTTARTTFDPSGRPTVTCQDLRMSFLNPGDRALPDAPPLADPCATFDCGANGECVPMNMTPTCRCSTGYVAVGAIAADGSRATTCVLPDEPVPASFYDRRVPQLPDSLPGGRPVDVPPPAVVAASGGCNAGGHAGSAVGLSGALLGLLVAVRRRRRS
ncbi:DUF2330 domain-containing protein [Sorangium atrum]|uniref:DUF2330 domain-containing protein n=1 Tax=Sorangium atrum TaxID=2995308 RepID=A0ABT5C4F5_9BACT|nr:DUF2330 domain-containing protein [Sorangium aterium]MDC0681252.1 DUF2330 domain-containing protein [Sorangium aterium]